MRPFDVRFALLAWAGLLLPGCGGVGDADGPGAALPNVLLVTLDTTRADHCSAYGYARPTTPALEALAAQGVLFEQAYAPTATTAPSHATLFTSLAPRVHGVSRNGVEFPDDHAALAELMGARGYRTGAVVSSFVMSRRFGFDRGFAHYDDDFRPEDASALDAADEALDRRAGPTTERALHWVSSVQPPFLLWVHYFDAHAPLDPPEPWRGDFHSRGFRTTRQRMHDLYDAELRYADDQLARLLAGVREHEGPSGTLVVVAGDHGEGLRDHGWDTHGIHLYEEAVRIPLVLAWPGHLPGGVRTPRLATLADVLPTLMSLLDLPTAGADFQGRVIAPPGGGASLPDPRTLFFRRRAYRGVAVQETDINGLKRTRHVSGPMWAVRRGSWKLIYAPEEGGVELYNLANDPEEQQDRAHAHPERVEALLAEIAARRRANTARARAEATPVGPADAERLRALGYVK